MLSRNDRQDAAEAERLRTVADLRQTVAALEDENAQLRARLLDAAAGVSQVQEMLERLRGAVA